MSSGFQFILLVIICFMFRQRPCVYWITGNWRNCVQQCRNWEQKIGYRAQNPLKIHRFILEKAQSFLENTGDG